MVEKESPKNEQVLQYNELSAEYASFAEVDPSKRFVQYPEALKMLGDVNDKEILDIGCGSGIFTRMLARRGAKVVGYDSSEKQVQEAQGKENQENLGIKYFVSDRPAISPEYKFDEAVSVLVLLYATDKDNLRDTFGYAKDALKEDGTFVSITFNPKYKRLGEAVYNRKFSRTEDRRMQVDFLNDDGSSKISAKFSDFSTADYENAATQAGFTKIEWVNLHVTPEGKKAKGKEFWQGYEDDCPYIGLKVSK